MRGKLEQTGKNEVILEKAEIEKREVLFRLLQYSLFEESGGDGNEMNEEAIFPYPWFEAYFSEEGREGYFIREGREGKLAGFVMINCHMEKAESGHSIAEFMVVPGQRRKGIGRAAAWACFQKHQGNWEVAPVVGSSGAMAFWKSVIEEYTGGRWMPEDGIFSFVSGGGH